MTTIREHAEQYLAMRRALGFKLVDSGRRLLSFVSYLEARGHHVVTTEAAVAWAIDTPRGAGQAHWSDVSWWYGYSPGTWKRWSRPPRSRPRTSCRPPPTRHPAPVHPAQITALLNATDALRPALRAATYRTLIGLLAVTGLRDGEACRLDRADVDLNDGVLTVRDSKFGKNRQVPLHDTTLDALRLYGQLRDELVRHRRHRRSSSPPAAPGWTPPHVAHLRVAARCRRHHRAARTPAPATARPTPHLRVATLLDWYRDGVDVHARLPPAEHLPRPRRPQVHLLVPDRRPRAARPGRRAARSTPPQATRQ